MKTLIIYAFHSLTEHLLINYDGKIIPERGEVYSHIWKPIPKKNKQWHWLGSQIDKQETKWFKCLMPHITTYITG